MCTIGDVTNHVREVAQKRPGHVNEQFFTLLKRIVDALRREQGRDADESAYFPNHTVLGYESLAAFEELKRQTA